MSDTSEPGHPNEAGDGRQRSWRALLGRWLRVPAGLLLAATLAGRAGQAWWRLDLLSHFAVQYAIAAVLLGALAWWGRARLAGALAGAALLINLVLIAPLYKRPAVEAAPNAETLRVCAFNVQGANRRYDEAVAELRQAPCDVVFVLEVRPAWLEALGRLAPDYRVALADARRDNFGIALLSRGRPLQARVVRAPDGDIGFIEATLQAGGQRWALLGVHPPPPVAEHVARERDEALDAIADWAARQPGPAVVIGDLNLTPYSPRFSALLDRGKLSNSQRGFGVQASWPNKPRHLWPGSIPIDHALHNAAAVTLDRRLGAPCGSDHRPLYVTFAAARASIP